MVSESTRAMFDALHAELDARSAKTHGVKAITALIELADDLDDEHADDGDGHVSSWQSGTMTSVIADARKALDAFTDLIEAAKLANELVHLLTVRQVIEAGDKAISAAGLNPWCIKEGLADGTERLGFWRLDTALARVRGDA